MKPLKNIVSNWGAIHPFFGLSTFSGLRAIFLDYLDAESLFQLKRGSKFSKQAKSLLISRLSRPPVEFFINAVGGAADLIPKTEAEFSNFIASLYIEDNKDLIQKAVEKELYKQDDFNSDLVVGLIRTFYRLDSAFVNKLVEQVARKNLEKFEFLILIGVTLPSRIGNNNLLLKAFIDGRLDEFETILQTDAGKILARQKNNDVLLIDQIIDSNRDEWVDCLRSLLQHCPDLLLMREDLQAKLFKIAIEKQDIRAVLLQFYKQQAIDSNAEIIKYLVRVLKVELDPFQPLKSPAFVVGVRSLPITTVSAATSFLGSVQTESKGDWKRDNATAPKESKDFPHELELHGLSSDLENFLSSVKEHVKGLNNEIKKCNQQRRKHLSFRERLGVNNSTRSYCALPLLLLGLQELRNKETVGFGIVWMLFSILLIIADQIWWLKGKPLQIRNYAKREDAHQFIKAMKQDSLLSVYESEDVDTFLCGHDLSSVGFERFERDLSAVLKRLQLLKDIIDQVFEPQPEIENGLGLVPRSASSLDVVTVDVRATVAGDAVASTPLLTREQSDIPDAPKCAIQ